jgi:hypothetical protein
MPLDAAWTQNLLALLAIAISLLSLMVSLLTHRWSEMRETRVEKSTAYLNLETNSSAVFQYAAENAALMEPMRCPDRPAKLPRGKRYEEACEATRNLYFQSLNLFEVCARFRRQDIIEPQVFASWVAWFYELQDDWFFRSIWKEELRSNYTRDVRAIFDIGTEIFESVPDAGKKEAAFYDAVAEIMDDCPDIRGWQGELEKKRRWTDLNAAVKYRLPGTSPLPPSPLPPVLPAA